MSKDATAQAPAVDFEVKLDESIANLQNLDVEADGIFQSLLKLATSSHQRGGEIYEENKRLQEDIKRLSVAQSRLELLEQQDARYQEAIARYEELRKEVDSANSSKDALVKKLLERLVFHNETRDTLSSIFSDVGVEFPSDFAFPLGAGDVAVDDDDDSGDEFQVMGDLSEGLSAPGAGEAGATKSAVAPKRRRRVSASVKGFLSWQGVGSLSIDASTKDIDWSLLDLNVEITHAVFYYYARVNPNKANSMTLHTWSKFCQELGVTKNQGNQTRVQHIRRIDKARLDLILRGAVSAKVQSAAAQRLGQMRSPRSKNHVTTTNRTNKAKRNTNHLDVNGFNSALAKLSEQVVKGAPYDKLDYFVDNLLIPLVEKKWTDFQKTTATSLRRSSVANLLDAEGQVEQLLHKNAGSLRTVFDFYSACVNESPMFTMDSLLAFSKDYGFMVHLNNSDLSGIFYGANSTTEQTSHDTLTLQGFYAVLMSIAQAERVKQSKGEEPLSVHTYADLCNLFEQMDTSEGYSNMCRRAELGTVHHPAMRPRFANAL